MTTEEKLKTYKEGFRDGFDEGYKRGRADADLLNPNIIARELGLSEKTESKHEITDEMANLLRPFKEKKPSGESI